MRSGHLIHKRTNSFTVRRNDASQAPYPNNHCPGKASKCPCTSTHPPLVVCCMLLRLQRKTHLEPILSCHQVMSVYDSWKTRLPTSRLNRWLQKVCLLPRHLYLCSSFRINIADWQALASVSVRGCQVRSEWFLTCDSDRSKRCQNFRYRLAEDPCVSIN
jgi:hypothetical protein